MLIALSLVTACLLVWTIVLYNLLVRDTNRVRAAWSDIEVQLKRRHDLIPKLVAAVDAYARYERTVLDHLVRMRADSDAEGSPAQKARLEAGLSGALRRLFAVAEAYPDLKADQQFLSLQTELSAIENDIQSARRYYNGAVRNLNVRIDSFPDLIVARCLRFASADFFELDSGIEAQPPEVTP